MIDSHAHLTSPQILPVVDGVIQRAKEAGITKIINICTDSPSLEEGLRLTQKHKEIFNTAATTPHDVEKDGEAFFPVVEKHISELVAIGETGLDYFYEHSPRELQREFLSRYFSLAIKSNLPVVFHCREAFPDLFAMADEQYKDRSAVLHCFTGTIDEARGCLDRGWFVSLSGIITYKKSEALCEVVKFLPLDRMFIETDTPYLAPQKHRGKQNEPAFMSETAEKIAELKNCTVAEVKKTTTANINQFFALK